MKQVFNGKTYNSETGVILAEKDCHHNGNYAGTDYLMATPKGALFFHRTSNGQDCYRYTYIEPLTHAAAIAKIDGWDLTDENIAELSARGLIEEA